VTAIFDQPAIECLIRLESFEMRYYSLFELTQEKLSFLVDLNNPTRTLIAGTYFSFSSVYLFVSVCLVVCLVFHCLTSDD
jgi:hypothetical protein